MPSLPHGDQRDAIGSMREERPRSGGGGHERGGIENLRMPRRRHDPLRACARALDHRFSGEIGVGYFKRGVAEVETRRRTASDFSDADLPEAVVPQLHRLRYIADHDDAGGTVGEYDRRRGEGTEYVDDRHCAPCLLGAFKKAPDPDVQRASFLNEQTRYVKA